MFPEKITKHYKYSFKLNEIFKDKNCDIAHVFLMDHYSRGMHIHEHYEVNVILKGSGVHYVGDEKYYIMTGDVFTIPPGVPHGYIEFENLSVCHLALTQNFFDRYASELCEYSFFGSLFLSRTHSHLLLTNTQHEEIFNLMKCARAHRNDSNAENNLTVASAALLIVKLLCLAETSNSKQKGNTVYGKNAILSSITRINECYGEPLSIELLAKAANLSRSSFIRKFKEFCDLSPASYVMLVRINAAKKLLEDERLSISDVASKCGFYDAAHFSKKFKEKTGTTPLGYRKSLVGS